MYFDGYKYWLAYKNENTSYYRCCRYISSKCPGRCINDNGKITITTQHNHPAEPNRALIDKFRKTLTHRAATEKTELHVIYCDEAASRHTDAALLYPFTSAESAMRKARRKQLPQAPKSIGDLIDVLDKSDFFRINSGTDKDPIYQKTITVEDAILMIFMHRKTFELFGRIEEIHLDASFEFVSQTQPTYYMITVHSVQGNITAPIIYGLLTAKTHSAYTEFFRYIREELKILPNMIVSDFDQVMQSSLTYIFPESIIKGCWFHYTDAVICYMKNVGLQKETAKGIGSSALRMLLVLPLLPPEYMAPGLEALRKWMKEKNIFSKSFSDLCDYIEQVWLRSVGAQKMSIFGATRIMSNHLKKFNKELASVISDQNPVIWVILDSITQLATKIFVRVNKRIKAAKHYDSNSNINNSMMMTTKTKTATLTTTTAAAAAATATTTTAAAAIKNLSSNKMQKKNELIADNIISNATQMWIKTPVHLRNTLQFLQLTSHFINDTMFLSYLSDIKERNYLLNPQRTCSINESIVTTTPIQTTIVSSSISTSAITDFQQNNWINNHHNQHHHHLLHHHHHHHHHNDQHQNHHHHHQDIVQQVQQPLEFIHQQETHHITQNNYINVTTTPSDQQFLSQNEIELQQNTYSHCYMQNQFSNMNINANHQQQQQQQQQQHEQDQQQQQQHVQSQQQYLRHQQTNVFTQDQISQQYMDQEQQEQFSRQQNQQQTILQQQQQQQQQQHPSQQLQGQCYLQNQQQQQQIQQESHINQHQQEQLPQNQQQQQQQQQQHHHHQNHQSNCQQLKNRCSPSEPPPLRMLPNVKRFPCKRRLPLLSELPPLIPISSKRPNKPS